MAKALGSGVVQGSYSVGSGVVQGSKAVSSGMVQGTLAAGKLTKDVTLAVGKGVYLASEVVGNAAVNSVSAAGEATISAGRVVTNASVNAVMDTTKWVKEQSEGLGQEDCDRYTVLPGDTIEELANIHNIKIHDLIRTNRLSQRKIFPGKKIYIPNSLEEICAHPDEILAKKAFFKGNEIFLNFTPSILSATFQGTTIVNCDMDSVVKIHLDICELIDYIPDLLPANFVQEGYPSTIKICPTEEKVLAPLQDCQVIEVKISAEDENILKEEFLVIMELEYEDCNGDGKKFRVSFPQVDLVPIHDYLDLWHAEKLDISKLFRKQLSIATSGWADCNDVGPKVLGTSAILNERHINKIHLSLPQKIWAQSWQLAYSTRVNGFSLLNLYRTLEEDPNPCLIVINDTLGFTFGAFLTCAPRISERFIGTGKSWLFCFGQLKKTSRANCCPKKDNENLEDPKFCIVESSVLNVFNWSGKNDYFFKGTTETMIMGASDGKFGIVIDSDLHKGQIQACQTFEGWGSQDHDFLINCLECWRFV